MYVNNFKKPTLKKKNNMNCKHYKDARRKKLTSKLWTLDTTKIKG